VTAVPSSDCSRPPTSPTARSATCWARRATTASSSASAWTACCAGACCRCSAPSSAVGRRRAATICENDAIRHDLEAAALLFVFRALYLLYAESAGHLPMANPTYRERSLTRTAERAWQELDAADPVSTALWDDVSALVRRMRTGHTARELPAYKRRPLRSSVRRPAGARSALPGSSSPFARPRPLRSPKGGATGATSSGTTRRSSPGTWRSCGASTRPAG